MRAPPRLSAQLSAPLSDDEAWVGEKLVGLERPRAPADFTASLLVRLPPAPAPLTSDDLAAVCLVAGSAVLAGILFLVGDGTSALLGLIRDVPTRALAEAAIAASLQLRDQVPVLLALSTAALAIGAPLWRVLSQRRAIA